jgi:hypothetical protein
MAGRHRWNGRPGPQFDDVTTGRFVARILGLHRGCHRQCDSKIAEKVSIHLGWIKEKI